MNQARLRVWVAKAGTLSPYALLALFPALCQAQLTITTTTLPGGQFSYPYSATLVATGGVQPYTWSITGGSLPTGLSLNSSSGAITGTVTGDSNGFNVTVMDSAAGVQSANLFILICHADKDPMTDNQTFLDTGGSSTLFTQNFGGCGAFTASSGAPWISITNVDVEGGVSFAVAANGTPATRTGTINAMFVGPVAPINLVYNVTQLATLKFATPALLPAGAVGQPYSVTFQATGGSNLNRSFSNMTPALPPGLSFGGQTLSGTPTSAGGFNLTIQVQDQNPFTTQFFSAAGNFSVVFNPPLSVPSSLLPEATIGDRYSATLSAAGGIPPYQFSITAGSLPPGLTFTPSNNTIFGTPAKNSEDLYPLTIQARDAGVGLATAQVFLRVNPPALTVQNPSLAPATEGVAYKATFTATGGTPPYAWIGATLPPWLKLTSDGLLSGTPPAGSAGSYTVSVTVQDGGARFNTAIFSLTVNPVPLAITTSSPLADAKEANAYSAGFVATGGKGTYTWSASGLPAFLSLAGNGALSGTPPAGSAGSYSFSVKVNDTSGGSASGSFSLKVNPLIAITTASPLPQGAEGKSYSATFDATGGVAPYKWSGSGLPAWAQLSASGVLDGTPPVGDAGASNFSVTVTDSLGNTRTTTFSLVIIAANGGLTVITPSPLQSAAVGKYYQAELAASGGTQPYKWTGSAPDGLTIGSNGIISGTPTSPGNTTVTAQVTDAKGNTAFGGLNLLVSPAKLTVATSSPLAIGELNIPYSAGFQSSGGARPTVWSLASGSLPPGLSLDSNGALSGTPTTTGNFNFAVQVTDTSGATVGSANSAAAAAPDAASSTTTSYELLVKPFGADLVLSAASLTFAAVRGGAAPPSETVSVITSTKETASFSATADAAWLSAAASGTTPGRIDVNVDQTGLTAATYSGTIAVTSPNRPPLAIKVTLTVAEAPPILQVSPASLQFFSGGTTPPDGQSLFVHNSGQGNLNFSASSDSPWLSVAPASGTVSANLGAPLAVTASVLGLTPGSYLGNIEVASTGGVVRIPVSLTFSARPKLILSSTGILLQARQGSGVSGPAPAFLLSSSSTPLSFTVQAVGPQNGLSLATSQGTATNTAPTSVGFQINSASLAKGVYYSLLRVTAPDAFNSPQDFVVVLNVVGATTPPVPDPSPSGLIFSAAATRTPPAQTVTVYTSSDQSVPFQTSVATQKGSGWLAVAPAAGSISTSSPAQLAISTNATGLAPGIYTGGVNISISNLAVRTVNITLIVPASTASTASLESRAAGPKADPPQAACTPASLVVAQTGLAGNFSTPAAWPRSVAVQLADDCGNAVANGRVLVEFSNGDQPLSLRLSDAKSAVYSVTWTPTHSVSQLTVTAQASATGLKSATTQVVGGVSDTAAPILARNGTVHNLYPQAGAALAPGTIVAIFGSALAANTSSSSTPLPTEVNGTSVVIGGQQAPLYFVSSGQINAQLPVDLTPGQEYPILVVANNAYTTPDTVRIADVAPGVARFGDGKVIAQHSDFALVTVDSPAKPGEFLVIYLAGMGQTSTPVPTGGQAPSSPLANVNAAPTVTLDGAAVQVFFAGLTPGSIGLYQINFQVPADAKTGSLKLEISQAGIPANVSVLPVVQ